MKMSLRRRIPVSARSFDEEGFEGHKGGARDVDSAARGADVFWQDPDCSGSPPSDIPGTISHGNSDRSFQTSRNSAQIGCEVFESDEIQNWTKDFGGKRVHFDDGETSDEMQEFFAWKQMYYEANMQNMKQMPEKSPEWKIGDSSYLIDSKCIYLYYEVHVYYVIKLKT